ncbi:MAG: DegT/DnrJ/EryC1/StrS family aminotransferase [Steroidobacteraceae bacterium]
MAFVAPAGTPLTLGEIVRGLAAGWGNDATSSELCRQLGDASGSVRAWPTVSGRAAMTMALRAISRAAGPGRDQVVIPAYTCYSVPAAIERAGLVPVPCDVDPDTLSLDLDHLDRLRSGAVVALITANLFGIPNALSEIERWSREQGAVMLDDAAQALGARLDGRPVGGFGHLGLYSFDKGKNISTIQGGALVARPGPHLEMLDEEWRELPPSRLVETASTVAKLLPYSLFLPPSRYGFLRRLPMLGLGETRYDRDYPMSRLSAPLAGLALLQLARIAALREGRLANAHALRRSLDGARVLKFVKVKTTAEPAYTRFPVRVTSPASRAGVLAAMDRAGIGATGFYPRALVDVAEVARRMPASRESFAGAREVASTIVTLPTHAYSPAGLAARVRRVFDAM